MKAKNKACCVIGHHIVADESSCRLLIKLEIEKVIAKGYTKFITYYKPRLNVFVIEEIINLKNAGNELLSIELIYISSSSIRYFNEKKRIYAESLCDRITITADRNDIKGKEKFCNYLTRKCDNLLCFEEEFRLDAGRYNAKVLSAFTEQGHSVNVFKL